MAHRSDAGLSPAEADRFAGFRPFPGTRPASPAETLAEIDAALGRIAAGDYEIVEGDD